MDPMIHYSKAQCPQTIKEKAMMRKIPYREAVGMLMYCAMATRPDIAFPTALQFVENPGPAHWEAVKALKHSNSSMEGPMEDWKDTRTPMEPHRSINM